MWVSDSSADRDGPARRHSDIGLARQIGEVEGNAAAETMQDRTHDALERGVLAVNRGHALTALLLCWMLQPHRGRGV
jgi:hypothetical protein